MIFFVICAEWSRITVFWPLQVSEMIILCKQDSTGTLLPYVSFNAVTLFADYFLTLDSEVENIWRRGVSGATVMFLLIRYVTLAERIILTTTLFLQTSDDKVCLVASAVIPHIDHTSDTRFQRYSAHFHNKRLMSLRND